MRNRNTKILFTGEQDKSHLNFTNWGIRILDLAGIRMAKLNPNIHFSGHDLKLNQNSGFSDKMAALTS